MRKIRTIEEKGKIFAVIPLKDYKKLRADAEMNYDIATYDSAISRVLDVSLDDLL